MIPMFRKRRKKSKNSLDDEFLVFDQIMKDSRSKKGGILRFLAVRPSILLATLALLLLLLYLSLFQPDQLRHLKIIPQYISTQNYKAVFSPEPEKSETEKIQPPRQLYEITLHTGGVILVEHPVFKDQLVQYKTDNGLEIQLNNSEIQSIRKITVKPQRK